jgi:DNA end-binding protein Ku
MLLPQAEALMLIMLRFPQELVPRDTYSFPDKSLRAYRVAAKEMQMAQQLVESMTSAWTPKNYRDDFREKLGKLIQSRIKTKGGKKVISKPKEAEAEPSGKVVDFMALLKQSIASNKRTPAKRPRKTSPKRRAKRRTARG